MGSLCCCFHVPDAEENAESNSSNHGNCMCPNCFIQNLTNKYGALFGRVETHAIPSFQGAASSSSMLAPNNPISDTGTHLPNDLNPQNSQLQNDFEGMGHGKGTSHSHLEPELHRRSNVQIGPKICTRVDKRDGSHYEEESKECHSESSVKVLLEKVENGIGYVYAVSEDEDVCPTCLEEYTKENPKIITHCRHNYHLSCIFEWMERSESCPICGKLMEFDETS